MTELSSYFYCIIIYSKYCGAPPCGGPVQSYAYSGRVSASGTDTLPERTMRALDRQTHWLSASTVELESCHADRMLRMRQSTNDMEQQEAELCSSIAAVRNELDAAHTALRDTRTALARRRGERSAIAAAESSALREILRATRAQLDDAKRGAWSEEKELLLQQREELLERRAALRSRREQRRRLHESEVVNFRDVIRALSSELEDASVERNILRAERDAL